MKLFTFCCAALIGMNFYSSTAQAASRTWVSAGGTNTGTCSITAPCATFSYAMEQTAAGGEVTCLDSGAFGQSTVTNIIKSIVINCLGLLASGAGAGSGAAAEGGVFAIFGTSASDRVVLRGLDLQSTNGTNAIDFSGRGTLVLDHVKITSKSTDGSAGILFEPSNGPGRLVISDSMFTGGGGTTSGAGILVKPFFNGTAQVTINRVTVSANAFGIAVDGSISPGGINMTISDSVLASNVQDGIVATSSPGNAPIAVLLTNVKSTNNGYGIRSIGSNVTVRVKNSDIAGNVTGLATLSGGALLSAGNNLVQANGSDGSFTGSVPLQ